MLNPYKVGILTGILSFILFCMIFNLNNNTNNYRLYNIPKYNIKENININNLNIKTHIALNNILKRLRFYENLFKKDKFKNISCNKINILNINKYNNDNLNLSLKNYNILLNINIIKNNLLGKCNTYDNKKLAILEKEKKNEKRKINNIKEIKSNKKNNIPKLKDLSKISIITQKRNANTCIIDNLGMLIQYEWGRSIDKTKIYSSMGKKIGDFWHTGLFSIGKYGGKFTEVKKNSLLYDKVNKKYVYKTSLNYNHTRYKINPEYEDFKKLYDKTNIETETSSNIEYMQDILDSNKLVLFEVPMSVIYPNEKKWKNSNIFHAITVINYNKNKNSISYINTLTGKIENLDFNLITYNKNYLKYPFRYLTGNFNNVKQGFLISMK